MIALQKNSGWRANYAASKQNLDPLGRGANGHANVYNHISQPLLLIPPPLNPSTWPWGNVGQWLIDYPECLWISLLIAPSKLKSHAAMYALRPPASSYQPEWQGSIEFWKFRWGYRGWWGRAMMLVPWQIEVCGEAWWWKKRSESVHPSRIVRRFLCTSHPPRCVSLQWVWVSAGVPSLRWYTSSMWRRIWRIHWPSEQFHQDRVARAMAKGFFPWAEGSPDRWC